MHLTLSRADLARVLTNVGRVIEARNTIPILSSFMLEAGASCLHVTGTDLDIVATDRCDAKVQEAGSVCVEAKLLADIAKKAGADEILLLLEGDKLIVKSGRSRFSLQTLPSGDFPSLSGGTFDAEFNLDIAGLFTPVGFAISTEETRYYLNGTFLIGEGGSLTAVATDGHRLARNKVDSEAEFAGIIVPKKLCGMLPKGVVAVSVSQQKIQLATGDFTITSKLIDGTFPDYNRVIPVNNDKVVTIDRDVFLRASDRVVTISNEKGRGVRLAIAPGSVALTAKSDVGTAEDEVPAEYTGEPIEVGFNSAYVRDMLSVLPSGPIQLALQDGGSPGLIKSPTADGWLGVLMPLRV